MIPIFIGWDRRETVAWHVLAHSISRRASEPVTFSPVGNETLPAYLWSRKRGPHDSTDFSNARFMVPALMGWDGWAIFMDCDMVSLADIAELWAQRDPSCAIQVVKHQHEPTEKRKFLGAEQSRYRRKNWSSLMLMNCAHPACRRLTPEYVNAAPGVELHGFEWCSDDAIGEIRGLWNVLVTGRFEHPEPVDLFNLKLLHYTLGGPWHGYDPLGAERWREEFSHMVSGDNPCAAFATLDDGPGVWRMVGQFKERFQHETA